MARPRDNVSNVELRVPCKPEYVRTVRALVGEMADSVHLSPDAVEEVKVAVSEAVANIVRHAYSGTPDIGPVVIKCETGSGKLTLEIIDKGVGFDVPAPGGTPIPDVSREGGLGIILIRNLMDSVDYWSKPNFGTRIKMVKRNWQDATRHDSSEFACAAGN